MDLISWSKWAPGFPNGRGEDSQGTGGGPVSKTIRKLPKTMRKKKREGGKAGRVLSALAVTKSPSFSSRPSSPRYPEVKHQ